MSTRNFWKTLKRILWVFLILLVIILCCILALYAGLLSGVLQNATCNVVSENSAIARQIECEDYEAQEAANGDDDGFSINIADESETEELEETQFDAAQVYEETKASVVGIGVRTDNLEDEVIGSGFVVSTDGLIATNQHVVSAESAEYFVKFEDSDELIAVEEIFRDRVNDLAILQVDAQGLPAITLGDDNSIQPGQEVAAIGNPLGNLSSTITSGIISAINREVEIGDGSFLRTSSTKFEDAIQTDAAINPGNSGGPLLNGLGHVIGINFATVPGFDNLSFAIPVSYLKTRLQELNEYGRFRIPYIGIQYNMRLVAVGENVFVGARVIAVDRQGAAAGILEPGDIIVTFNGQDLENDSLQNLIQRAQVGETVELGVIHEDGTRDTVELEIAETPQD